MYLLDTSRGLLSAQGIVGAHMHLTTGLMFVANRRSADRVANSAPRYKDFPPGWGHITVPTSSRSAALAGLGLYSPCRRSAAWAQWAARACVMLFGPAALPGRSFPWVPVSPAEWSELSDAWRRELGAFDEMAGYSRLQASRTGMAVLLLRAGSPIAFVKLRQGESESLFNERRALDAVWNYQPRAFQVPKPLQSGYAAGWHYLVSTPLPPGLHRPPSNPPLAEILGQLEAALACLPRPSGVPDHWRPMHGDFAPWNLRQLPRGPLVLVDWENAGWGPPGADEVLYRATWAALRHRSPDRCDARESVQFWRERLLAQPENVRDHRLAQALGETLDRMADA
jgi:phosphotransferase family enzyme